MKYLLVLDESKCVACGACAVACMDQRDIEPDQGQTPLRSCFVVEEETPGLPRCTFLSVGCMHCQQAPCITACPTGCIAKDVETGFTVADTTNCIGCHSCAMACPFGHPTFSPVTGKMVKCDGCVERVKAGMKPACVKVCPFGALQLVREEDYVEMRRKGIGKILSYHLIQRGN